MQKRSRQHDQRCRLNSSQFKSVYFNHPSQGNSTNYYIILGPRDKAAPPASQQIGQFPPKRVKYRHGHPVLFLFLPHSQESSLLSTNQRQRSPNWANIPRTCWANLFRPRIQLRRSWTNNPNYIREAKVRPIKNQLHSPNIPNYVLQQMFAQLRTGLMR